MPLEELLALVLGVTGKDSARIGDILRRGSLVAGASRFRWTGLEAPDDTVAAHLMKFPDSDPARPFHAEFCFEVTFRGGSRSLVIERAAGEKRRLMRRTSFWDELMTMVKSPSYVEYSYRHRADVYRWRPGPSGMADVRNAAKLLAWSSFEAQIKTGVFDTVDLMVRR
jgi:hypothetical protein